MDRKAQGLPITTIIIAILGLVVLVILFAILTGRLTIFAGAASECPGICVIEQDDARKLPNIGLQTKQGVLETIGSPEARQSVGCVANIEKRMYGSFIAQGMRGNNREPVPCKVCCARLA